MSTSRTRSGDDRASPAAAPEGAVFELVPIERLLPHEQIVQEVLEEVLSDVKREGGLREPILVAEGTYVVLNGHHRLAALTQMGARRIPAWVIDYLGEDVELERWPESTYLGAVTKQEVLAHARSSQLFPPKTTRHRLRRPLPYRMTSLQEML